MSLVDIDFEIRRRPRAKIRRCAFAELALNYKRAALTADVISRILLLIPDFIIFSRSLIKKPQCTQ